MAKLYLDSGGASTNSGTSDNAAADLSGSGNATIVANATFVDGNVNTGTDIITVTAHGYTTGSGAELTTTGTLPAGLTLTTLYFLRSVSANEITLHPSVSDAEANTNIVNITGAAGGGTHTINNYTINLGGSPDLSGVKVSRCRVTTTGTSHIIAFDGIHGLSDGDIVVARLGTGGTIPVGLTNGYAYHVHVSTLGAPTTTCRLYSALTLAIAGGASDVNVSAAEVRTFELQTPGQSAIAVASATNTNRKIFWIRAVSDTNDLVVVDVVVTSAASNWAIGGQVNVTGAPDLYNAGRNGDEVIQNTDLTANPLNLTLRNPPTSWVLQTFKHTGKSGAVRAVINQGNGDAISIASTSSSANFLISNCEVQSQGTGQGIVRQSGGANVMSAFDLAVTDSGGAGFSGTTVYLVRVSLTGCAGNGASISTSTLIDCRSSGNGSAGFSIGAATLINCIADYNTTFGVQQTVAGVFMYINCTIYHNNSHGFSGSANYGAIAPEIFINNIIKDNGDASNEYNIIAYNTGTLAYYMRDNCVTQVGGRGGTNVRFPADLSSSDITTDPLFVDPDAAYATRNLGLQSGSPAKGISYSFGGLTTSYRDMGAVQRQESAAGGGLLVNPGMRGGMI